jgi:hypothetical protein
MALKRPHGSKPGEHRGGRKKGTPNKRSLPTIITAIKMERPDLDGLSLQRYAAAGMLNLIEKAHRLKRVNPKVLFDWYAKLARVAEGYYKHDRDETVDYISVRADLERLNPEQILAFKQLALIAAGAASTHQVPGGSAPGVRRSAPKQGGSVRARKDAQGRRPS